MYFMILMLCPVNSVSDAYLKCPIYIAPLQPTVVMPDAQETLIYLN